jgi:GT2 family glycosyltransferase
MSSASGSATVIVPTLRGADRIGALLDSLGRQTVAGEVIVVDNGSTDGTSEVLAAYPEVEVMRLEENVGFARAVNLAAGRAGGDALVLVNDDCVLDPGFVEEITGPLGGEVVMSAGVLRDPADERLIDTAGIELSRTLNVFDYLHGQPLAALDHAADPIGPSGAAAAFDRDAFLDAGGFDEALFAYWEDVDLALRLRLEGARCALAGAARGTHAHSATLGFGSAEKNLLVGFGRGYVARKWTVLRGTRALRALVEDGAICVGQAFFDRNVAGLTGRVRGARAARQAFPYPGDLLRGHRSPGMLDDLARRLRRRRRLIGLREESPRKGLERQLDATTPWSSPTNGEFAAELTVPPANPVGVGKGTVTFLAGRMDLGNTRPSDVELLVDGETSGDPVAVVNPGGGRPAFWWTLLELPGLSAPRRLELALRSRNGGAGEIAELGTIEAAPGTLVVSQATVEERSSRGLAGLGEPVVAICMTTYEPRLDLFAIQVESIKAQTHPDWICLISDDGSSPDRLTAMRGVIGDDPRLVLVENQRRLGFYGNYERVLGMVPPEADLIALADQDDRWYPEKLEALIAGLGDRDLVYGDMRIVREDGSLASHTYWSRRRNNYTDLMSLLVGNTVTGAASLFRADLLKRALPFPPRRSDGYHDHWIALVAMTRNGLAYVDRPLQDYVQHTESAQGHEQANAGASYLQLRLVAVLAWQGLGVLIGRRGVKGWASRYFGMYVRTVIWARVLQMRSPDTLTPRQARILERVAKVDRSPLALLWVLGRSLRPLWGRNEAFGRELLVLSSVLWGRALELRSRPRRMRAHGGFR